MFHLRESLPNHIKNNPSITWTAIPGLKLENVKQQLMQFYSEETKQPQAILIHAGGNDIGFKNYFDIRVILQDTLNYIQYNFPNTKIIWSDILYRFEYRNNSLNLCSLEKLRLDLNKKARSFCREKNNVIRHQNIYSTYPELYFDKVHLNATGNAILAKNIFNALPLFKNQYIFEVTNHYSQGQLIRIRKNDTN